VGDFPVELDHIIDKRELTIWNRALGQVKVHWKHLIPEEATWEMESNMWEAYPFMFQNGIDGN